MMTRKKWIIWILLFNTFKNNSEKSGWNGFYKRFRWLKNFELWNGKTHIESSTFFFRSKTRNIYF